MRVKDIMTQDVKCCSPDANLEEVARMMVDNDCGEIPVVESGSNRMIGVITDRDIVVRAVAKGSSTSQTKVSDCMSSPAVSVDPDCDLDACLDLMEREQIRRVPVVDDNGACCGIVSQADIALRATPRETAEVVREISEN